MPMRARALHAPQGDTCRYFRLRLRFSPCRWIVTIALLLTSICRNGTVTLVSMPMGWTIRADRSLWQPCWREIASRHNAMVQQHHRESPSMAGRHTGARGIPALDGLQLRELFPEASGIADPPFLLWRRGGTFEPAQVLLLWKWAVPLLLQGRAGFSGSPCQCAANHPAPTPAPLPSNARTDNAKSLSTPSLGGLGTVAILVPSTVDAGDDHLSTLRGSSALNV